MLMLASPANADDAAVSAGREFSLDSRLPFGYPAVDRIWFRYYTVVDSGQLSHPAVVIVPPVGSADRDPLMDRLAVFLAKHGIASAVITLPYHGERNNGSDMAAEHFAGGNLAESVHAYQQSASDIGTVATWLQARPDVDPSRIGIVGVSLGAVIAHLVMGLDDRFTAGVAIEGGGDLPDLYRRSLLARVENFAHPRHYTRQEIAAVDVVDPLTYAGRNRPRRVLMIEAARDLLIPPRDAEELWQALGRPPIRWMDTNHFAMSLSPESAFEDAAAFLNGVWNGQNEYLIALPKLRAPTLKLGILFESHRAGTVALQWQALPIGQRRDHMPVLGVNLGISKFGPFATVGATVTAFVDAGVIEHYQGGSPDTYVSFHIVF